MFSPVCVPCCRPMRLDHSGVVVEFQAIVLGPGPYQQVNGDQYQCDGCGATVIARYAAEAFWQAHQKQSHPAFNPKPNLVVPERRGG